MEKHYEDSNILFLESRAHFRPSQICIAAFTIYDGSNIFCEILNIRGKDLISANDQVIAL